MPLAGIQRDVIPGSCLGAVILTGILIGTVTVPTAMASVLTTPERAALLHEKFLENRRGRMATLVNPYRRPALAQIVAEFPPAWKVRRNSWHHQIGATVFWVGEQGSRRNPVSEVTSSWDPNWEASFGGYDNPVQRHGYWPRGFEPKLNPFYIALPYNDILHGREHRPEAPDIIPWFWRSFRGPGISVCHNRWIAIHHRGRIAYAQWKDVGPSAIDDWPYVFEGKRPRVNANQNAGINISPAVRDFLGIRGNANVDWRFVEEFEVPGGPWARWLPSHKDPSGRSGDRRQP